MEKDNLLEDINYLYKNKKSFLTKKNQHKLYNCYENIFGYISINSDLSSYFQFFLTDLYDIDFKLKLISNTVKDENILTEDFSYVKTKIENMIKTIDEILNKEF